MVYEDMLFRIAEIELEPGHFEESLDIVREEKLEAGLICIYPMYESDNPSKIRLLEIYTDRDAYESHLKTPLQSTRTGPTYDKIPGIVGYGGH